MMNLKIVYPLLVSRVNQDGSPYEFTENRFFNQTKLFADYQKVDLGYVAKDDENYYLIPNEAGVEINPEMHGFGNPDINEAYKKTENVSDYTKAYAAFGKDRTLDYSAQIDKDLLDTNTENILGVSLVKVDENYQPTQVMPSVIGPAEQKIPTNNALLKETLDLIRSHIANKSNAHAIESIVGLSNSLNQLVESISSVNTIANNSLKIAEGAATTAGEAAQAINEHAQATTNPHATNVTQEFADTQITQLATEATYTPTVWTYLVGLFTTVPKSVKEHIAKVWTVIENLKSRITFLENNLILSITLTEAVAGLDIVLPTPEYDIELEVDYTWNSDGAVVSSIKVNDVSTNNYVFASNQAYGGFASYCGRYASKGVYRFSIINNYVFCTTNLQQIWGNTSTQTVTNRQMSGYLKTQQSALNKITFNHIINAGSVFIIRRVRRHG